MFLNTIKFNKHIKWKKYKNLFSRKNTNTLYFQVYNSVDIKPLNKIAGLFYSIMELKNCFIKLFPKIRNKDVYLLSTKTLLIFEFMTPNMWPNIVHTFIYYDVKKLH